MFEVAGWEARRTFPEVGDWREFESTARLRALLCEDTSTHERVERMSHDELLGCVARGGFALAGVSGARLIEESAARGAKADWRYRLPGGGEITQAEQDEVRFRWEIRATEAQHIDSTGRPISPGSSVRWRGRPYTVRAFWPTARPGSSARVGFEEQLHVKGDRPHCVSVDLIPPEPEPRRVLPVVMEGDLGAQRRNLLAMQFVDKWLWETGDRETAGQPWPDAHIRDAARMLAEYRREVDEVAYRDKALLALMRTALELCAARARAVGGALDVIDALCEGLGTIEVERLAESLAKARAEAGDILRERRIILGEDREGGGA